MIPSHYDQDRTQSVHRWVRRSSETNCKTGKDKYTFEREKPHIARRWAAVDKRATPENVGGSEIDASSYQQGGSTSSAIRSDVTPSLRTSGKIIWLLGNRCVELSVSDGTVRVLSLPLEVKPGSRAVQDPERPDTVFVLENGRSRLWRLGIGIGACSVEQITSGSESSRFRSSLGSRLIHCGAGLHSLVVTGTPGRGAVDPWLFDLKSLMWTQLPPAPHAILSSAAFIAGETLTIVGGWSKDRGCHGHLQTLSLREGTSWSASPSSCIPWRRPGAGACLNARTIVALGWMECEGVIGSPSFRLLRRNGGAQRARSSSSALCELADNGSFSFLSKLPLADSFEHNGELYQLGHQVVCVGRDHIQLFDMDSSSWQTLALPRELFNDSSNSWVKHCGSWAMAFLADH